MAAHQGSVYLKGVYTDKGRTVTAIFDVNIVPAAARRGLYMNRNKSETLKFYKVKNTKAEWKSSKAANAFVDENGVIEARKVGKSTVSAKINGITVKIEVIILD